MMRQWIACPIVIVGVMVLLAGCAQSVDEAKEGPPQAAPAPVATAPQPDLEEAAPAAVIELSEADFDAETGSGIVLVDFWAPWCGPCRIQGPIIDEVAREAPEGVKVAKLNVDTARGVSSRFSIRGIPTLMIFQDGEVVEQFVGVTQKEEILAVLKRLAG